MARVVIVDWESLHFMCRILGIGKLNFRGLYQVLAHKIGTSDLHKRPICVLPPHRRETIGKSLQTAGFEVVAPEGGEKPDDAYIIDYLSKLQSPEVTEVVLVSADQDFAPVLLGKSMTVHWVATRARNDEGKTMVASALEEVFEAEERFNFVELKDYQDLIMREPARPRPPIETPSDGRRLKISLEAGVDTDSIAFLRALLRLIQSYPDVRYTIEG